MEQSEILSIQEEMMQEMVLSLPKMRKRLKISQTELGDKVGLSRQTISSIERKTAPLTWNNYLAIMMFFALNSEDVFYFPRRRGYKYANQLMNVMKAPGRIGGKEEEADAQKG